MTSFTEASRRYRVAARNRRSGSRIMSEQAGKGPYAGPRSPVQRKAGRTRHDQRVYDDRDVARPACGKISRKSLDATAFNISVTHEAFVRYVRHADTPLPKRVLDRATRREGRCTRRHAAHESRELRDPSALRARRRSHPVDFGFGAPSAAADRVGCTSQPTDRAGIKKLSNFVGVRGFEPPTAGTQSRPSTRLRYTPREAEYSSGFSGHKTKARSRTAYCAPIDVRRQTSFFCVKRLIEQLRQSQSGIGSRSISKWMGAVVASTSRSHGK
jgi:hypothetical protein